MLTNFKSSHPSKKRVVPFAVASMAVAVLFLTGCSPAKESTFQSVYELKDAYEAAGGTCTGTTPFAEITESYGIKGLNCANNGDALAWFRDEKAKSDFLDLVGGSGSKYVVGKNWMILTNNTSMFSDALGGEIKG